MENSDHTIQHILERNKRVEADKAWEVSWTRRLFIAGVTYITACIFLYVINSPNFAANAVVPAIGYLLSTLSLPWLKKWWLSNR
jgi:hypothetical protein